MNLSINIFLFRLKTTVMHIMPLAIVCSPRLETIRKHLKPLYSLREIWSEQVEQLFLQRKINKIRVEGYQGQKTYKWWIKMETNEGQQDDYWVTSQALLGGGIVILLSFIHPGDTIFASTTCTFVTQQQTGRFETVFRQALGMAVQQYIKCESAVRKFIESSVMSATFMISLI